MKKHRCGGGVRRARVIRNICNTANIQTTPPVGIGMRTCGDGNVFSSLEIETFARGDETTRKKALSGLAKWVISREKA